MKTLVDVVPFTSRDLSEPARVALINVVSAEYPVVSAPLALPTLGATLRYKLGARLELEYVDMQVDSWPAAESRLRSFRPGVIGISSQVGSADALFDLLKRIQELNLNARVVVGNVTATYAADYILAEFHDVYCCIGRGEETLVKFVQATYMNDKAALRDVPNLAMWDEHTGKVVRSESRTVSADYVVPADWANFLERFSIDQYDEFWIEGSRGCPQKRGSAGCTYCAILPDAGSRDWSSRDLDVVLADLTALTSAGVRHVRFADEEFMANQPRRALELAFEMRHAGLMDSGFTFDVAMRVDDVVRLNPAQDQARSSGLPSLSPNELRLAALSELRTVGLKQIYLGVESGSARQLRRMRKGAIPESNARAISVLRRLNVQAACGWIMFDPFLTQIDDLLENISFIHRNRLLPTTQYDDFVTNPINRMRVLVGTPLLIQVQERGLLRGLKANLVEYDFAYVDQGMQSIVTRLEEWEQNQNASDAYQVKNKVAHSVFGEKSPAGESSAFFQLKRLSLEVCEDLVWQLKVRRAESEGFNGPVKLKDEFKLAQERLLAMNRA